MFSRRGVVFCEVGHQKRHRVRRAYLIGKVSHFFLGGGGGVPVFLSALTADPLVGWQVEMGDADINFRLTLSRLHPAV